MMGRKQGDPGPGLTSATQLGYHPFKGQLPNKSCSPHTLQPQSRKPHPRLGWSSSRSHPCKMSKQGVRPAHGVLGPQHLETDQRWALGLAGL